MPQKPISTARFAKAKESNAQSCPGPCQLCGRSDLSPWEVHSGCVLWHCDRCDLYQYGPEPGSHSYQPAYHSGYEKNRERKIFSAMTRLSYIRDLIDAPAQSVRALDVGCSIGASVEAAERLQWKSVGVDVSKHAVDFCNRLGLKCFAYQGQHLPFEDETFDVVTAWHVIEHVLDASETLSDWKRVLKPGGLIVLATPDGSSPKVKKLGKAYKKFWAPEHTYTFTPDNLGRFAENVGLEVSRLVAKPNLRGLGWNMAFYEAVRRWNENVHLLFGNQKEFCLVLKKPQASATQKSQRRAA